MLEDGELIAHGTHDELLEISDLYREIVEKGLPDQVFLTRKPVRARGGGLVTPAPVRRAVAGATTCAGACAAPAAAGASCAG